MRRLLRLLLSGAHLILASLRRLASSESKETPVAPSSILPTKVFHFVFRQCARFTASSAISTTLSPGDPATCRTPVFRPAGAAARTRSPPAGGLPRARHLLHGTKARPAAFIASSPLPCFSSTSSSPCSFASCTALLRHRSATRSFTGRTVRYLPAYGCLRAPRRRGRHLR